MTVAADGAKDNAANHDVAPAVASGASATSTAPAHRKALANSKYVLLTTFRKDGTPVPTPVWVVPHDDGFSIWTGKNSGKVKRIRRNPRVQVAFCDRFGRGAGAAMSARAEILPADQAARVLAALRVKYGWWAALYVRFQVRGERAARMAYLKVTLD